MFLNQSLFFSLFLLITLHYPSSSCYDQQEWQLQVEKIKIEAMFIFGDSMIDGGNNFYLPTDQDEFKSLPYGIDFPSGPTGRFSNGGNLADAVSWLLGIPSFIPAFMDNTTSGVRILNGVNYASGGSGILEKTGMISLSKQVQYFKNRTITDLRTVLGSSSKLKSFLSRSLFMFNAGGNDIMQFLTRAKGKTSVEVFMKELIDELAKQLEISYHLGARKFVVFGVQAIGCNPSTKASHMANTKCAEEANKAAITFNDLLKKSLIALKNSLPDLDFAYINTYKIVFELVHNAASYGFKVVNETCCTLSTVKGNPLCQKGGSVCSNRKFYVYWDGAHFTEAAYSVLASKAFSSRLEKEVYPYSIQHLARLAMTTSISNMEEQLVRVSS